MYCASCGNVLTPGLSYCNRCGANLVEKESTAVKLSKMAIENLVWAIVAMATLGIGATIALMALMKFNLNLADALIVLIAFAAATPFILAELVFIWMLLRAMRTTNEITMQTQIKGPQTRELEGTSPRSLNEPVISVVEQTTRTLETVPRRRQPEEVQQPKILNLRASQLRG